jgi:hypothetical protein
MLRALLFPTPQLILRCAAQSPCPNLWRYIWAQYGLGMRPPTLYIAFTPRFPSPSCLTSSSRLVWGNPHDILMNGRPDGVDFACPNEYFQIMNPISFHRRYAHNRIQKSVMVLKHFVLRSLLSQRNRYCPGIANSHRLPCSTLNASQIKYRALGISKPAICSAVLPVQWSPP